MRSRLEDQRGTEINFELPDFLKDKENNSRKLRRSGDGAVSQNARFYMTEGVLHPKPERITPSLSSVKNLKSGQSNYENRSVIPLPVKTRAKIAQASVSSPSMEIGGELSAKTRLEEDSMKTHPKEAVRTDESEVKMEWSPKSGEPPPLPPKPKILPIRPSNWGQNRSKGLYLEQPTSSFV